VSIDPELLKMFTNTNNHILDLVKSNGELSGDIKTHTSKIEDLESSQEDTSLAVKQLTSMMRDKMTPDRCAHMHDEIRKDIIKGDEKVKIAVRKEIFEELSNGAKGWGRRAWWVLKVLAASSLIFGGTALGAKAIGLIKILGG